MVTRETVIEVLAGIALAVDVPRDAGSELQRTIIDDLDSLPFVRHVTVDDVHGVDETDGGLQARFQGQITLHFAPDEPVDEAAARDRLASGASVAKVNWFEVRDGPYEVESW